MDTKTVEIRPERSGRRPPLLRALEYLLYAVLFVVLVVPPAFIYGLIIKDAANFRKYGYTRNFYDLPGYGVTWGFFNDDVAYDRPRDTDYLDAAPGDEFYFELLGRDSHTELFTMLENPAYTFDDGTDVMLWRLGDMYDSVKVYVLENGDFIMRIDDDDYVDDWSFGEYCTLPDEGEEKILDVVRARLPYDVEQSLEWVYSRVKGRAPCMNFDSTEQVGYGTHITLATEKYVFVDVNNYAVDEGGDAIWLPSAHCIFDRSTGEQVSIDRLCVGGSFEDIKLELTRRMLATRDPNFDSPEDYDFTEEDIAEAAEHLDPADIYFDWECMSTTLMPGSISRYPENAFGIGVRYSKIEDLITFEP